jgi:branched-chain amino acid transport system permease protein
MGFSERHIDRSRTAMNRKTMIGIIVVLVVLALLPMVITSRYHMHLIITTCINVMLGYSFSLLYSAGMLSIAGGAFWGIGAYASALLVTKLGFSFWAALPLSALVALLVALILGIIITRTSGLAFMIQTLVLAMIIPEIFGNIELFGGWAGLLGIPAPNPLGSVKFLGKVPFYYLAIILLLLNVLVFQALYYSRVGRAWKAIRLNPNLAAMLGVNIFRYRMVAFMISSASAGLAGSLYAHYFQSLEPGMFGAYKGINIQIFSLLGGLDFYILGPVIGAAIMTFVPEFLRVSKEIEPILTGALLIFLVIFLPGGILSIGELISSIRQLFVKKNRTAVESGGKHE